ncbi:DUF4241 domain-containing protein [Corynebacterium choanae]|uniref:DUF4241 domain-containing protein n=1 Tax=Corynebacterium choanae TaxID=1862358 RepID=A0A3G6J8Z6_9CORY|nr:DUF4241 domain-containing protein [Corynebacterium choanae]AZA14537.1 hypothetical protein CCHOA_10790 [Corynebacterium choanae]
MHSVATVFAAPETLPQPVTLVDAGLLPCPSGSLMVFDPMVVRDRAAVPGITVPVGTYPVTLAVSGVPDDPCYLAAKVTITPRPIIRLAPARGTADGHTFESISCCVDAGMAALADAATLRHYLAHCERLQASSPTFHRYDELFAEPLRHQAVTQPRMHSSYGDWLRWTVPNTADTATMVLTTSGFGDGCYPCLVGYDEEDICSAVFVEFVPAHSL